MSLAPDRRKPDVRSPGRARSATVGWGGTLVLVAVLAAGCGAGAPSARHTSSPPGADGLVGYPAFLPRSTLHYRTDGTEVGTSTHPALTSQGDPVKVVTSKWSVVMVVTGPEVPGEGLPYQPPVTTCTWTVSLSKATGVVPVDIADFDTVDGLGGVYQPFLVPGQPAPPPTVGPGQVVSFELRAGEPVGQGVMRWAPFAGRVVAKWDYVVEND